jgi:gluconate 5-dehydrogenase
MKANRWGRIINISSIFGTSGFEKRVSYSAAKAGLIGMTRSLALEVGRFGITVNCLAPGPFLTELTQRNFTSEQRERISGRLALGRWAAVDEIGGPALLFASDAGSFITGTTIAVDGGAVKVG